MVKAQSVPSRVATAILRAPPRIFPIPGWFPVVVERLHPLVGQQVEEAEVTTHGVRIRLNLNDYIQQRIFYESHEPALLAFVERFVRPGDVVLDAGAHVGIFTLLAASLTGPTGEVHSFEPVPSNFEALEENVRLNGFRNVTLNQAAVGAEPGEVELGLPDVVPDSGTTSAMYTVGGGNRRFSARVVTLDSYVERLEERPIRLLKMDVEGFEPAALDGFATRLGDRPPEGIVLEVNVELLDKHGFGAAELLDRLVDWGYRLHRISPFGRLREHSADFAVAPLPTQPLPNPRLAGWLRRYRAEGQLFFNLVAVQPGVDC
jgi:FkbM family methyltransferase